MHDEKGYYSKFQQSLYFARLHTDQLIAIEQGAEQPSKGQVSLRFDAQRHNCFGEAAISSLFRALCYLSCSIMPEVTAIQLLQSPRKLLEVVAEQVKETPSASLQILLRQLQPQQQRNSPVDDDSLALLLLTYQALWLPPAQSRRDASSLIAVRSFDLNVQQCQCWARQLAELGELFVESQTES